MILRLETVGSTQSELIERIRAGDFSFRGIAALEQTHGHGRHGRSWFSPKGSCLAFSFWTPLAGLRAELVGMWAAIAAAKVLDCDLQWPNDLSLGGKKLGGVIAETAASPTREKYAVIGIGANLTVADFPSEIADRATSLLLADREIPDPFELAESILEKLDRLPKPSSFAALRDLWSARDSSAGKAYQLPDGRVCKSIGVGDEGQLHAICDGEAIEVRSAEAWQANLD